jgi:4-methylaminobutanoate oxidase (formaldehyde-forming)
MFAVRKSDGFVGHDALMERKASGAFCKTVSITIMNEDAVPLGHEPIYLNGEIIGQTSSCGFGYRVGKPIALGHVNTPLETGTQVQIDVARTLYDAEITLGPLFDTTGMRMKG